MKYKLDIPEYVQQWIVDELLKRNGEVKDEGWNHYLHKLGWIKEIEELKKPELIEFGEACQKMENGQTFKFGSGKGGEEVTKVHDRERDMELFASNQHDEYVLFDSELLGRKGYIIPAEPKIITAEYHWRNNVPTITNETGSFANRRKPDILDAFGAGEKNQWLNHKPLVDAVKNSFTYSRGMSRMNDKFLRDSAMIIVDDFDPIFDALENLKPLE